MAEGAERSAVLDNENASSFRLENEGDNVLGSVRPFVCVSVSSPVKGGHYRYKVLSVYL